MTWKGGYGAAGPVPIAAVWDPGVASYEDPAPLALEGKKVYAPEAFRKRFAPPATGAEAFFSLLAEATPPRSRLREPLAQGRSGDAAASADESGVLGLLVKRYPGEPGLERFRRVDHGSCPAPVFYGPQRLTAVETMSPIFT